MHLPYVNFLFDSIGAGRWREEETEIVEGMEIERQRNAPCDTPCVPVLWNRNRNFLTSVEPKPEPKLDEKLESEP
jgi:hypothetical protein